MAGPRRGVGDRKGYAGREAPGASAAGAVARSGSVSSRSPLVDLRLPMSAVGAHAPSRTWKGPLAAAEEAFHHLPWPKRLRPAKSPVVLRSVRYPCFGQKPQRFPLCVMRRRVRNRACGLSGSPRQETAAVGRTAPDERGRIPRADVCPPYGKAWPAARAPRPPGPAPARPGSRCTRRPSGRARRSAFTGPAGACGPGRGAPGTRRAGRGGRGEPSRTPAIRAPARVRHPGRERRDARPRLRDRPAEGPRSRRRGRCPEPGCADHRPAVRGGR